MDYLPVRGARRCQHGTIDDARVVGGAVEEGCMPARFVDDQHAGGMIPRQRARMQRELADAARQRHIFEAAAALVVDAADTTALIERLGGAHARFRPAIGGAADTLCRHIGRDSESGLAEPSALPSYGRYHDVAEWVIDPASLDLAL